MAAQRQINTVREAADKAWTLEPGKERENALTRAVFYLAEVVEIQQRQIDALHDVVTRNPTLGSIDAMTDAAICFGKHWTAALEAENG